MAVQVNGIGIADLVTEETDLEDIFLQLTRGPKMDSPAPAPVDHMLAS